MVTEVNLATLVPGHYKDCRFELISNRRDIAVYRLAYPDGSRATDCLKIGFTNKHSASPYSQIDLISNEVLALAELGEDITGGQCFASGNGSDYAYMITNWVSAPRIKKRAEITFPLFLKQLYRVADKVALLHDSDLVHGDIQPNHFCLDDNSKLYMLDLALAHDPDDGSFQYKGGAISFVSPEIAFDMRGSGESSIQYLYASDVYSFGAMAYFLLTGQQQCGLDSFAIHPIFEEITRQAKLDAIVFESWTPVFDHDEEYRCQSAALADLIKSCLVYDPQERPSMDQVETSLARIAVNTLRQAQARLFLKSRFLLSFS